MSPRRATLVTRRTGRNHPSRPSSDRMRPVGAPREGVRMEMTSAKAMLVDPGDLDAGDAVTTTIPRAAIEEALASDEPTDLYLDVLRPGAAGADEAATVSVAWERPDLERLL